LWGHSSSVDHCQTFNVFTLKNNKTSKKPVLKAKKFFSDTGCACTSSVASKERAVIKQLAKNLCHGKNAYLVVMYTSAL
jgi:hypothetical protein